MSISREKISLSHRIDIVLKLLEDGDADAISLKNGISSSQLLEWKNKFLESVRAGLQDGRDSREHEKIRRLEKIVKLITTKGNI